MRRYDSISLTILLALALTIVVAQAVSGAPLTGSINQPPLPPYDLRDIFETYLLVKTVITSINLVLLIFVFAVYIRIYSNTGSRFSLGLVFFTVALMLYAITSNPILHALTGFRVSGLGPFTILPDLFTLIASAILLYLSRQ